MHAFNHCQLLLYIPQLYIEIVLKLNVLKKKYLAQLRLIRNILIILTKSLKL